MSYTSAIINLEPSRRVFNYLLHTVSMQLYYIQSTHGRQLKTEELIILF